MGAVDVEVVAVDVDVDAVVVVELQAKHWLGFSKTLVKAFN